MYLALVHAAGASVLGLVYAVSLPRERGGYAASTLWLGMPYVRAAIALQLLALVGLVTWVVLLEWRPPSSGFLAHPPTLLGLSALFYAASLPWAPLAVRFVDRPTYARAALTVLPLWCAGAAALALAVGTQEAARGANGAWFAGALGALAPLVVLTVGVDALGWSALAALWVLQDRKGART